MATAVQDGTRTLIIDGMHCQSCVSRLTEAFTRVPGILAAHVTLSPPQADLKTSGEVPLSSLQSAAAAAGDYKVREATASAGPAGVAPAQVEEKKPSLYPLILIVGYIAGAVLIAGWARSGWRTPDWHKLMLEFMAGFFLVFSFFKLLDLRGFADAYRSYDIVARRSRAWALAYPFVELSLGVAYLTRWNLTIINVLTLALMLIGSIGVLRALLSKRAIRCACLGTALNLPMTTVTLMEDLAMAAMAALMLAI